MNKTIESGVWFRPDWDKHVEQFGNSYFFALETVVVKLIGYNPTIKRKK